MSKSHNLLLTEGWVYHKCKGYIISDRPKIALNPFEIEDYNTAKEYIKSISKEIRETALDVKLLYMKFPQLKDEDENE